VSSPNAEMQAEATFEVLKELKATDRPMITVLNKVDKAEDPNIARRLRIKFPKTVQISALNKEGFDELAELMMKETALLRRVVKLKIPQSQYALVSELMREGKVISSDYEENDILLEIEIPHHLEYKAIPYKIED